MIRRSLNEIDDRYATMAPVAGVTLADLGVLPYSPPDEAWEDDLRMPAVTAPYEYSGASESAYGFGPADMTPFAVIPSAASGGEGMSFADMVRPISAVADPGAWREADSAPFWIPDDAQVLSGPSFNDFVRFIGQAAGSDAWRGEDGMSARVGWENPDPARYGGLSDPMRTTAPGAFRIPGLPDDAAQWNLREFAPTGPERIPPVQLANWKGLAALWLIWSRLRGGRLPADSRAPGPSGRKGEPLRTPDGPPRNPPGEVNNRPYAGHAFDKMQDQRLPPSVIENTVRRGVPRPGNKPGATRYYDKENNVSVVVDDKTGRVITNHYGDR